MFRKALHALWMAAAILQGNAFAASALGGDMLSNRASATYLPAGFSQLETISSNEVRAQVAAVEALSLTLDQSVNQPPGARVTLSHLLTNTGNVPSRYRIDWANGGAACQNAHVALGDLRVVRDLNTNGGADVSEPPLVLGTAGVLTLAPGESATLLAQGTLPQVPAGAGCLTLRATTAQGASAANTDQVTIVDAAVLSLTKTASSPGLVTPGASRIDFTVTGTNIGARDARAMAAGPGATTVTINGQTRQVVLLRDTIPPGTHYVAGSLQASTFGAIKLFRLPADAPWRYRTGSGSDDASAIEVGIALEAPAVIARNASIRMSFTAQVDASASQDITNIAQAYFDDGLQAAQARSNLVLLPLTGSRLGVAKMASPPLRGVAGHDDVAESTFTIRVRNYGAGALYDVRVPDLLEGSGATQFGTYTAAPVPAAGQYTIVPGSLGVSQPHGRTANTVASIDPAFQGTAGAPDLLAGGAVLAPGAELDIVFTARWNSAGHGATLSNSVTARAATSPGGAPIVDDDSVDGADPDPDGDGNPNNNAAPTLVRLHQPVLALSKSVSAPRRVGPGVYDLDFFLTVRNDGDVAAPFVRVIDNLDCAFEMDRPTGRIGAWQLQGAVKAANGLLRPFAGFTGRATCNRTQQDSIDPYDLPTQPVLGLVDGTRELAPGQAERLSFTVRVTLKDASDVQRARFANKAWATAVSQNALNVGREMLVGAAASQATGFLIDPQGTVYDAVSSSAPEGSNIALRIDGVLIAYLTVHDHAWSYTYAFAPGTLGNFEVRADLVDVAGNIAVSSVVKDLAIDTSGSLLTSGAHDTLADQSISVTAIVTDTGVSDHDFLTKEQRLLFTGVSTAADHSNVAVRLDGVLVGYTTVVGGAWTFDYRHAPTDLAHGDHVVRADLVDLAGNIAVASADRTVSIDTAAPTLTIDGPHDIAKGPQTYYFNFSEPIAGFDASDIGLSHAKLSDFKQLSATQYSATITPVGVGSGTMTLNVNAHSYTDIAGNDGGAASATQDYFVGPPKVLDLGVWGQGIKPWQVPGTNKVFYYLDTNKDGWEDGSRADEPGDDKVTHDWLDKMFNGGVDTQGITSTIINDYKISLPGFAAPDHKGNHFGIAATWALTTVWDRGGPNTYKFQSWDDFYGMRYITETHWGSVTTPLSFWSASVGGTNDGVVVPESHYGYRYIGGGSAYYSYTPTFDMFDDSLKSNAIIMLEMPA